MQEEEYKKELAANGVDVPELKPDESVKEEPKTPEKEPEKAEGDEPEKPTPSEPKKRSIYEEYKEKKTELKTEKELREKAERERDELQQKLQAISDAPTKQTVTAAEEDAIAYAAKIGADPDLVKRIIADARKGLNAPDESLKKDIEEMKAFKTKHEKEIAKQQFEEEFTSTLPAIKELFPKVSSEELSEIKKKVNEIAHTEGWHDKPLDYIVFKNKSDLSSLISPQKRGIESKGKKEVQESSSEFNPNADFSQMTATERATWEEQYNKMMKSEGLATDANGRKILI